MKRNVATAILALAASLAFGSPLELFANSAFNGTNYDYTFTLTLTNADGSWTQGDGWGWIVFGDSPYIGAFDSFVGDPTSFVGGPWTSFSQTGGANHGPTLSDELSLWVPTAIGDSVRWSGTADVGIYEGFTWSSLYTEGNALPIEFKSIVTGTPPVSSTANPVPEPYSFAVVALGLIGTSGRRKHRASSR